MMSSDFIGSFGEDSARLGYTSRLSSQRFDSARFESFPDYGEEQSRLEEDWPPPVEVTSGGGDFAGDGPNLPPPEEMEVEEGSALREWRRQNVIRLEEKDRKEKEMLKVIIEEADEYKAEFYKKWKIRCENSRAVSREKEKLFLESREKFHAEADKSYWKAIAELIPREVPVIEKKGKKEKAKKPSIVVIQGPKPGKATDLSRMRQILVKLKHEPPGHMMQPPQESEKTVKTQQTTPAATAADQGVSAIAK